jgi:adenylylsulfate kinase-like enzyme
LYTRFLAGEIKDVAGMDLHFPKPENPDLYIVNNGTQSDLLQYADEIVSVITKSTS